MARRNYWKKGDWLVVDEESGITDYASRMVEDWEGKHVRKRYADMEQPQDFIRPYNDPQPVPFSNAPDRNFEVSNVVPYFIGLTNIPTPQYGPAYQAYTPGIGDAEIEYSFIVY